MAYEGLLEDVKKAIALEEPSRTPVFAISEEFDVKWYGKWDYETVCQDGDKIAEVWIAAIEEFDYDWAWVQVDDCWEFEPLGVGCPGECNILRATRDHIPCTRETFVSWPKFDPATAGRIPEKLKAIRKIKERFGDTVLIEGSAAGPYSCVGLACGMTETMMLAMDDRALLNEMCDFFVEQQYQYIKVQVEAGAHGIWLGDCNAFSGMLSLEQYNDFAFPSCKKLVDKCKADFDVIFHLHNSEVVPKYLQAEAELGVDIISVGPAADIAEAKKALTGKCCFTGNLDPIEVLMRGTPELIESEVERIMGICKPGGGYIFSTGEMNPRDIPVENMHAMVKKAKELA
ncbi:MAG: uroporphyrinogen decarboxylase family protein [Verrucomicrobiota bacterium]